MSLHAQVTRDALQEFIATREPVKEYVARRYAAHDLAFQASKRESVTLRVAVARNVLFNS